MPKFAPRFDAISPVSLCELPLEGNAHVVVS
jgi:hypothetical protein